jgi:hypothetical protein
MGRSFFLRNFKGHWFLMAFFSLRAIKRLLKIVQFRTVG